jgi:hypothetical protein
MVPPQDHVVALDTGEAGIRKNKPLDHLLDDQQGIVDQFLHDLSVRHGRAA